LTFPANAGRYQKSIVGQLDAFVALMSLDLEDVVQYTFYGGNGNDKMTAMTTDANGSVLFVGETTSSNLPLSSGAAGQIYRAQLDGFVAKLDKAMSKLEVGVYIGGNRDDQPTSVAIDNSGNIFVAGGTNSTAEFPTTLAHQRTPGGQKDGFLCRLTPNGGSFVFSTYFGREGNETFTALAVNAGGEPFVTGSTSSSNFETAPTPGRFSSNRLPYDRTFNGGNTDAFVIKFFSDGTLSKRDDGTYSTYFGGNGDETGAGIFIDQTGRAIVVGTTTSTNLPTTGGFQTQIAGQRDIFMAVLSDDGRSLVSCTYFGGTGNDGVNYKVASLPYNGAFLYDSLTTNYGDQFRGEIMLDQAGNVLIASCTRSTDFPTVNPFQATNAGAQDGVIFRLSPTFNALQFSSYYGGSQNDACYSVKVDTLNNIFTCGGTSSTNLTGTVGGLMGAYQGGKSDGFVIRLNPGGTAITAGTYLGRNDYDQAFFVEVDRNNNVFVLGQSVGGIFPTWNAPYNNPNSSQFVIKLTNNLRKYFNVEDDDTVYLK
jgi:hypothetical protein